MTTYLVWEQGDEDGQQIEARDSIHAAHAYVRSREWEPGGSTWWLSIHTRGPDGAEDEHRIRMDPPEPACELPDVGEWEAHAWGPSRTRPSGGGVLIRERCALCGLARETDTWARDPGTGREGLTSVSYERGRAPFPDRGDVDEVLR